MISVQTRLFDISSRKCALFLESILYLGLLLVEEEEGSGVDWDWENGVMSSVFRLWMSAFRQEGAMGV